MYLNFPQRMIKIANKTRWLIILLVLLIIKLFPQQDIDYSQVYFLIVLAAIYNILVRFITWQDKWKDGKGHQICHAESTLDIVFITGIIYLTEGLQSDFFLLYFIVIMFASTYYKPIKCFLVTVCITLLYVLIGVLTEPSYRVILSVLLSKIPLLFAITGVSIYFSQEIKIQSEELELEREKLNNLLQRLKGNLKEIDKKNRMLNEIYNLSLKIGRSLSLEDELDIIIEVTKKFLKTDFAMINLSDKQSKELKFKVSRGSLPPEVLHSDKKKLEDNLLSKVIKTGNLLVVNDLSKPEFQDYSFLIDKKIFSLVLVPLNIQGKAIGVFICGYSQPMEFKEDDLQFLTLISSRASLSINNAWLHEEIKRLAITDGLTGLYNYRYFQETLTKELQRCKRLNQILSLLMIDIDHFKEFNDTYGHQEGDNLLQRLAMLLNFQIRQTDTIARYGGEEFVIIVPGTPNENAFLLGERIRKEVEENIFTPEDEYRLKITSPVTISVGVSTFPAHAINQKDLIKCADKALYEAKRTGRNKVVDYYKSEVTI
ncbi:MAG: sensor domain-containing diguanylate cyclase [Nitrospirota bacterium]